MNGVKSFHGVDHSMKYNAEADIKDKDEKDYELPLYSPRKEQVQSDNNAKDWYLEQSDNARTAQDKKRLETAPSSWICCDKCSKWRRVPKGVPLPSASVEWRCNLNLWDGYNSCDVEEEVAEEEEDEEASTLSITYPGMSKQEHQRHHSGTNMGLIRKTFIYEEHCSEDELCLAMEIGESVWALPSGRMICWAQGRPYAITHEGETLSDISREFEVELTDLRLLNAAIGFNSTNVDSVFSAGSTVLIPWLEDSSDPLWHVLTTRLLLDGWKLKWLTNEHGRNVVQYNPPLRLESQINEALHSLDDVLRRIPQYLEIFDMATQITAASNVKKLNHKELKPSFSVPFPSFLVGNWVLAKWPGDHQYLFAKIIGTNIDSTYDLEFDDGELQFHASPLGIRPLNEVESKQPRNTSFGRVYWSEKMNRWVAYHHGVNKLVSFIEDSFEQVEEALEDYAFSQVLTSPHHSIDKSSCRTSSQRWKLIKQATSSCLFISRATWLKGEFGQGHGFCPICFENTSLSCDEPVLEAVCCQSSFHKKCLDLQPHLQEGRLACPKCFDTSTFHSQLRASRITDSCHVLEDDTKNTGVFDDFIELQGRFVWTMSSSSCGVVRGMDRFRRLVVEHRDGSMFKSRLTEVVSVGCVPVSFFWQSISFQQESSPVWKLPLTEQQVSEQQEAKQRENKRLSLRKTAPPQDQDVFEETKSPCPTTPIEPRKVKRGTGKGYANGLKPTSIEWECELCDWLNDKNARRCFGCSQGSQAKSMVGRDIMTTNGPGKVAKSSGKGWVVVDTDSGGSYRMRLSQIWDYIIGKDHDETESGGALPLPAHRSGDPGMPKNWSFSLLKKRVQTSQGVGVVTDVIDKGWIGVRLENGRKVKTRPGNVTALEGDEVITTFAKKTKATHTTRQSLLLRPIGDELSLKRKYLESDHMTSESDEEKSLDESRDGKQKGLLYHNGSPNKKKNSSGTSLCADTLLLAAQHLFECSAMDTVNNNEEATIKIGTRVECASNVDQRLKGTVQFTHDDGTFGVLLPDGNLALHVSPESIFVL